VAAGAPHGSVAGGAPSAEGVGGAIWHAEVGFGLDDDPGEAKWWGVFAWDSAYQSLA